MVRLDELYATSGEAMAGRPVVAPSVGTRLLRWVHWNDKAWAVDDEATCRAWYCCHYPDFSSSRSVRHRLWTVGYKREPRQALILCPRALPAGVDREHIQPARIKLFVTVGDGYVAPLFWDQADWPKYLPKPTRCITGYTDPYYTDPKWWEDSEEIPSAGSEGARMMEQWRAYKNHDKVEPEYRIRFDRLIQEFGDRA